MFSKTAQIKAAPLVSSLGFSMMLGYHTFGQNPLLLATPLYAQLSFLGRWSGAPEQDRWAAEMAVVATRRVEAA